MKTLEALSIVDGRYHALIDPLRPIFCEAGLIRHRIYVEVQWVLFLSQELKLFPLTDDQIKSVRALGQKVTLDDVEKVKIIEATTNHDVKAVEYFIKEKLDVLHLGEVKEWVHFACTSEDINNTAYALMVSEGRDVLVSCLYELIGDVEIFGFAHDDVPMMSRTHGQPASPTTVGKEMINFAVRLREAVADIEAVDVRAKINGATGNYNAHQCVFPDVDWIQSGQVFIQKFLGLTPLKWTTQINSYEYISRLLHAMVRVSSVIIDFDRDMWGYISLDYFKQKVKAGEVGSSTMPHKVNPIDFENSEGNLGLGLSLMEHMAVKFQQSRFQRDLTDSTVLRNLGLVFAYLLIGVKNARKGLAKLSVHQDRLQKDLDDNWALLAEPFQMLLRTCGVTDPYEKMKALTRGEKIDQSRLHDFVEQLEDVSDVVKTRLRSLTPHNYIGLARQLVKEYKSDYKIK